MQVPDLSAPAGRPRSLAAAERDVERAVQAMRREMGLGYLRRRLRADKLDGRTALALADLAIGLQAEPPPERPAPRRLSLLRSSARPPV